MYFSPRYFVTIWWWASAMSVPESTIFVSIPNHPISSCLTIRSARHRERSGGASVIAVHPNFQILVLTNLGTHIRCQYRSWFVLGIWRSPCRLLYTTIQWLVLNRWYEGGSHVVSSCGNPCRRTCCLCSSHSGTRRGWAKLSLGTTVVFLVEVD
jgi:hypothetical protein